MKDLIETIKNSNAEELKQQYRQSELIAKVMANKGMPIGDHFKALEAMKQRAAELNITLG